ncbi:transporter [Geosmithia morbida]|uniref:Transporter n=1 Tax=Geosmithia morbida TaxID=1094350 RepID=A0A9P4YMN9_9HYPO|nr:transporter [Geosmithia morbida]KAF4119783.1 transporter [Geosmithia morbida]
MEPWYSGATGTRQALLTAILELGAWIGALINGYLADAAGRRITVVIACAIFTIGVIVQACTTNKDYVLGGRFVTGIGVGSFSMLVPLYNAELAPPEVRGALVALQQLAITFGIGYGTNFIGGTGSSQSDAAWIVPVCIQLLPSTILAVGMVAFMPQSPRHLMNRDREAECLSTLARLRGAPETDMRVRIEFLEIKALRDFERARLAAKFPQYHQGHDGNGDSDGSRSTDFRANFMIGLHDYLSLVTDPSLRRRTIVAVVTMVFQQWNGVNAILYYAPFIFQGLGLGGSTTSLLATGVVGIVMFLATVPAVLFVDRFGRKTILIAGGVGMAASHFIVAGITGSFSGDWEDHRGAGWAAVVFVWIYAACFGFSWGPVSWIIISEVFPLGMRAKGVSLGGQSNWLNNFAVAMSTSPFIAASQFGAFIFFGAITTVGAVWVYFFVPETKGRSLEEMDELFGEAGHAQADADLKERIERDIGLTALLDAGQEASSEKVGEPKAGDAASEAKQVEKTSG